MGYGEQKWEASTNTYLLRPGTQVRKCEVPLTFIPSTNRLHKSTLLQFSEKYPTTTPQHRDKSNVLSCLLPPRLIHNIPLISQFHFLSHSLTPLTQHHNLSIPHLNSLKMASSPTEIDTLISSLSTLTPTTFTTETDRLAARDALFEALRKVQSPWDIVWDHNWVNPATNASVKTLIDMGLFKKWKEVGGKAMGSGELAVMVGVDAVLLREFCCFLLSS